MSIADDRDDLFVAQHRANEALKDLAERSREAEKQARPTSSEMTRSSNVQGPNTVSFANGGMQTQSSRIETAAVRTPDPNMVTLPNGMTTTVEAARRAGFNIPDAEERQPSFQVGREGDAQPRGPENEGQGEAVPQPGETPEETKQIDAAISTIKQLNAQLGPAADAMQQDVVASGELPRELPSGVTQDDVDTAVKGYEAQANVVLRSIGTNIETLSQMLDGNELREARLATFRGDNAKLQELGNKAKTRLVRLPNDPARFAQLTAPWEAAGVKITQRGSDTFIKWHGAREMEWATAVMKGVVRF